MSKGPCVHCGNAAVDSRASFDKQLGHGFRGKCLHCGSTGPWFPSPSDAIHWATHPIHPNDPSFIRLAAIAEANGYVKLEPGQVVVQTKDLTRIVTWFRGDARTVPHADMDTTLNRFAAAIDAAKGEWK